MRLASLARTYGFAAGKDMSDIDCDVNEPYVFFVFQPSMEPSNFLYSSVFSGSLTLSCVGRRSSDTFSVSSMMLSSLKQSLPSFVLYRYTVNEVPSNVAYILYLF